MTPRPRSRRLSPSRALPLPPSFSHALALPCLALALLVSPLETVQGQMPSSSSDMPSESKSETIDVTAVKERLESLGKAKEPDEATKKALELYRHALESLKRAEQFAANTTKLQEAVAKVRDTVAEKKQQLAALRAAPEPMVAVDEPLAELERTLKERKAELEKLKAGPPIEVDLTKRTQEKSRLRARLDSAPERLAEIENQLKASPPADEASVVTNARRAELLARKQAVEKEVPALRADLALYKSQEDEGLVTAWSDVHKLEFTRLEREVNLLQSRVNDLKTAEAEARVRQARRQAYQSHPLLRPYAEKNRELAELARSLLEQNETAGRDLKSAQEQLAKLEQQFKDTKVKVDTGLTGAVGQHLRRQRSLLPDPRTLRRRIGARQGMGNELQWNSIDVFAERESLAETDRLVEQILGGAGSDIDRRQRDELRETARDVLQKQREYYDAVNENYATLLENLGSLDIAENRLLRKTEEFIAYVDERVLWIRSSRPMTYRDLHRAGQALPWLASPQEWTAVGQLLWRDVQEHPVPPLCAVVLFGSFYYLGRRFRQELAEIGGQVRQRAFYRFLPTVRAAFLTLMISVLWPGLLWYVGWRLGVAGEESQFARQVARALSVAATVFFPMELFRQMCRPGGLAEAHFDWAGSAVRLLRIHLRWLTLLGLPLVFMTVVLHSGEHDPARETLERLSFSLAMIVLAVFSQRVMRPMGGVFQELIAYNRGGWTDRLRYVWFVLSIMAPVTLAGLALSGYFYTAQQLAWRLQSTIWMVLALLFARAMLLRLTLMRHRKLRLDQARERRAAAQETAAADAEASPPANLVPPEEKMADLSTISTQTQRLVNTGLITLFLVALWFVWVDVLPALKFLNHWTLWHPTVTAFDLVLAVLIGILMVIAARNLPGLLEISILQRLPLDAALRFAITTLASYVIVVLGIVISASTLGISWSQVQWLAAALTLGLGFGLQEVFANFVCGLIILFERPVRVGDVVTIGDVTGVVTRIRIRATTLTNWDRKEFLVPNKEFITGRLLNWTLSDSINRITIEVGIAYGSDTELARELLLKIASEHPVVLEEPPPIATFEGFGDSTLNFTLRVYLPSLDVRLPTTHELHSAIHRRFKEHGIEIAFPQRDLHIRTPSGRPGLPLPDGDGSPAGDMVPPLAKAESRGVLNGAAAGRETV